MADATPPAPGEAPAAFRWIKTDCGRAKYLELAARSGPLTRVHLAVFVMLAALRDWPLPAPSQP